MTILIAERDGLVGDAAHERLAAAGFQVIGPIVSGADAREIAAASRLNGAVCTLQLQDGRTDGLLEFLLLRDVPIIVTTGFDRSEYPACINRVTLLKKPYDLEDLASLAIRFFRSCRRE